MRPVSKPETSFLRSPPPWWLYVGNKALTPPKPPDFAAAPVPNPALEELRNSPLFSRYTVGMSDGTVVANELPKKGTIAPKADPLWLVLHADNADSVQAIEQLCRALGCDKMSFATKNGGGPSISSLLSAAHNFDFSFLSMPFVHVKERPENEGANLKVGSHEVLQVTPQQRPITTSCWFLFPDKQTLVTIAYGPIVFPSNITNQHDRFVASDHSPLPYLIYEYLMRMDSNTGESLDVIAQTVDALHKKVTEIGQEKNEMTRPLDERMKSKELLERYDNQLQETLMLLFDITKSIRDQQALLYRVTRDDAPYNVRRAFDPRTRKDLQARLVETKVSKRLDEVNDLEKKLNVVLESSRREASNITYVANESANYASGVTSRGNTFLGWGLGCAALGFSVLQVLPSFPKFEWATLPALFATGTSWAVLCGLGLWERRVGLKKLRDGTWQKSPKDRID
jgi:hypothetical protein